MTSQAVRSPLVRLLGYARAYWPLIAVALALALLFAGGRFGRAYLMKPLLDDVLLPAQAAAVLANESLGAASVARAGATFGQLVAIAAGIVLVVPIVIFARSYVVQYVLGRISIDLKQDLAAKLLHLPLSFHREARSGDTVSRTLYDVDRSEQALDILFGDFLQAGIMVLLGVATLCLISWQLAGLAAGVGPLIIGVLALFSGRISRSARKRQEQVGEVTQRLLAILSGIKVIKAFRGEELEHTAFRTETRTLFKRGMKVVKNRVLSHSLVEMLNNAMGVGVVIFGTLLVLRGRWGLTTGDVAAFAAVLATTYKPIKVLSRRWAGLMEARASAERFFAILDAPGERVDPVDAVPIDGVHRSICFRDVSFSYGREPVLRHVNLEVTPGEVVAIVGQTGAGKTTLVDLLLGFYEPDSGSIEIDGIDVRRIARDSLLDLTAVVSQEAFLFDTTIRENIGYGRPNADDAAIRAAARAAHVDEFVDQLPMGYDTPVGEFGLHLSGGQRQRVTIARAILRQPAILLFDEATSALDAKTERTVQDAIEAMRGERTVFVVAHRLSTIRRADRIVVLEDGRVSQQGVHEELIAQAGLYRELVSLQLEGAEER